MKKSLVITSLSIILSINVSLAQNKIHTVKKGDTFKIIAEKYGITVEELKEANPDMINNFHTGLKLSIPTQQKDVEQSYGQETNENIPQQVPSYEDKDIQENNDASNSEHIISIPEPMIKKMAEDNTQTYIKNDYVRDDIIVNGYMGLNLSYLTGKGIKNVDEGVGYSFGVSIGFFCNDFLGFEMGLYNNTYQMFTGDDYRMKMDYLELAFLPNLKLVGPKMVLEVNYGVSLNVGLYGNMYYKGDKIKGYDLIGGKKTDAMLKPVSCMLLSGLTFRYRDFFARILLHEGLSNINNLGKDKVNIVNWDFSIGFSF